mgnify:FL=1
MCRATLKLRTHTIENPEVEQEHAPNRSILSRERDVAEYLPQARAWATTDRNLFSVWCGEYQGWARDENGTPLFCTYACGVRFAEIHYNGGHRVVVDGEIITRESTG